MAHEAEHAAAKAVHDVVEDKEVPDAKAALSATDKAELVLAAQPHRRKSSLFGRKRSWGRKSSAGSATTNDNNESVASAKSSGGEGGVGGGAWKPGHYLSRLLVGSNK